ncbi:MAG: tryptophan synthase subunit alpha [Flavobacteriaceae bacterium]|nr:MAG: tryptophan synthase subunit alpha [Flavobacteriaceae bacterium]
MSSVAKLLEEKSSNILSVYFTSGFPKLNDTAKTIRELSDAGVDFIEVGLPYSDPLADGSTIQNSSQKALKNGMNLDIVFDQLSKIKQTNETPLVLMGYLNQLLAYGEDIFCQRVVESGIDTIILPDLPMIAYENHYEKLFSTYGIHNVFLITPQTSEERIRKIDSYTRSFIYMVAATSITGAKGEISQEQIAYFKKIKAMNLKSKLIIGFGISDHNTFSEVCKYGNGAIIGSAFINHIAQHGIEAISAFVKSVRG